MFFGKGVNMKLIKKWAFAFIIFQLLSLSANPLTAEEISLLCIGEKRDYKVLLTVDTDRHTVTKWWAKFANGEEDTKQKVFNNIQASEGMFYWKNTEELPAITLSTEGWINRTTGEFRISVLNILYKDKRKISVLDTWKIVQNHDCTKSTKPKIKF